MFVFRQVLIVSCCVALLAEGIVATGPGAVAEKVLQAPERLLRRESDDARGAPGTHKDEKNGTAGPKMLAVLLSGVKAHFILNPLVDQVVAPVVRQGYKVHLFLSLVNASKGGPYKGVVGHPCVDPSIANLTREKFAAHVAGAVRSAGGELMHLQQPDTCEPIDPVPEDYRRLRRWRTTQELWGKARAMEREKFAGSQYTFVLWTREDQYWFQPLDLRSFERPLSSPGGASGSVAKAKMYTRNCALFSGLSDKVVLFERAAAEKMLHLYSEFYENKAPLLEQGESAEAFIKLCATLKNVEWEKGRTWFRRLPSLDAQFVRPTNTSGASICLKPYYAGDCLAQGGLSAQAVQPPRCGEKAKLPSNAETE
eukprot:TRINITY_DN24362_c0_g1_i2.p1 TRINITY_DN24362_c0_g1~~TRINITY_DN24362_c0_g1_i2.p1  ORF type:complete len:368 (-),score=92.07 TRINITY_DN24362_c0_g1_i2:8-1111(-)